MSKLRVMVTFTLLWVCTIAAQAPIENLVITESISPTQIEYVVTNTGTTTVTFSFIVIQDDVLMMTSGQASVLPGEQTTVRVTGEDLDAHTYSLELTELGNN